KDSRVALKNVNTVNDRNLTAKACYECGSTDHIKSACSRLNQAQGLGGNRLYQALANNGGQGRGNQGSQARGRAFIFVFTTFIPLLDIEPSDLGFSYEIEIASGQLVEIDKVIRGCKLEIKGHVFDINLIPFGSGSFDVIIGMDWLSDHKAEIICHEKVVRIPLLDGKGRVPAERLILDDIEAGSGWWVSSRAYFDGRVSEVERPSPNKEPIIVDQHYGISDLSGFQSIQGGPSSFQTPTNHSFFNMGTPINWQTPRPSQPGSSNWQSQMPAYTPTPNWQPPIPSHPGDAGLCDPKKCKNDNLSPLNLGNAFAYDNAGGDDVVITGVHDTGIYFTYENVDPNKQMNAWIEILIRSRLQNADWTVSKSGTACVHLENNRFMIKTDLQIIRTLDGSTRPYPQWKYVNWVYMPINVGGNHWVMGAVNLPHSVFYVSDSMESERTRLLLEHQIKAWTPVINGILQMRGYFRGSERQPHNFILSYNQGWGFLVPQQSNFQDCRVITCWLIAKLCVSHVQIMPRESERYWENIRYEIGELFYKCRCENTRNCGYD
ncbi:phospholipase-like protein, partial [Tanacetum coccineum]